MITQLCSNFFQDWGILIILVVFLIFMLVFSASKRKKDAQMAEDFANNLKVGDKIKTYSGIYGKIVSIKDTPSGKVATIETGEGKNVSYMTVDVFAIYNIETPVNEKKESNAVASKNDEVAIQSENVQSEIDTNEVNVVADENAVAENVVADESIVAENVEPAKKSKSTSKKTQSAESGKKSTTKKSTTKKTQNKEKSEFEKLKEEENK